MKSYLWTFMVAGLIGCDAVEEVREDVELRSGTATCPTWRCGFNSAEVNGRAIRELNLDGVANAAGMKAPNVKFVFSAFFFRKQERNYANTDGSVIAQTIVQSAIQQQFTAVSPDFSDFQNRGNTMPWSPDWRGPTVLNRRATTTGQRARSACPNASHSLIAFAHA